MHDHKPSYSNELKKKVCTLVVVHQESTKRTAEKNQIKLKTLEKWITAFRKDPTCFNRPTRFSTWKGSGQRYDKYTRIQLIKELKRRDSMIDNLQSVITARGNIHEKQ